MKPLSDEDTIMTVILVVYDIRLRTTIANALKIERYHVIECANGEEAIFYAINDSCDLMLLDWMLPGAYTGLSVVRDLRKKNIMIPIIMLTALSATDNKITGLDAGADDYVTKPFEMEELLARVRANIRRPAPIEPIEAIHYGDIIYYCDQLSLHGPAGNNKVSKQLGAVIELFLRYKTKPLAKRTIFAHVWGMESNVSENIVENYIDFFRKALQKVGSKVSVVSIRGSGCYYLNEAKTKT